MNAFAKPNLAVDQIPSASAADKDKVLTIDANGVPVWAENQGGGGGSGGGVLVVHDTDDTLDKTWQEIHDADFAVIKTGSGYTMPVIETTHGGGAYELGAFDGSEEVFYTADSADGYPVAEGEDQA